MMNREQEKQLYKDAVYFHLRRNGLTRKQADNELQKIFNRLSPRV